MRRKQPCERRFEVYFFLPTGYCGHSVGRLFSMCSRLVSFIAVEVNGVGEMRRVCMLYQPVSSPAAHWRTSAVAALFWQLSCEIAGPSLTQQRFNSFFSDFNSTGSP